MTNKNILVASVGDGVYGVNRAGLITFVNPAARRILGYPQEGMLIDQLAHRLFHYAHADASPNSREDCVLQKAYAGGDELRSRETVFWHCSGTAVPPMSSAPR